MAPPRVVIGLPAVLRNAVREVAGINRIKEDAMGGSLATRAVTLVLAMALTGSAGQASAQEAPASDAEGSRFGIGFQSAWPAYGISGLYDVNDRITAQAVVGAFGALSTLSGRGLYHFQREPSYTAYGYGTVGAWRHSFRLLHETQSETSLGLGGGAGIELNWRTILGNDSGESTYPPLFSSIDLGFVLANFARYNFSGIVIGAGMHYRF
jgi:hypothetical protein